MALITAASQGQKAHAAMLDILTAIGSKMNMGSNLLISFIRSKLDEKNELKDKDTLEAVKKLVDTFIRTIEERKE